MRILKRVHTYTLGYCLRGWQQLWGLRLDGWQVEASGKVNAYCALLPAQQHSLPSTPLDKQLKRKQALMPWQLKRETV